MNQERLKTLYTEIAGGSPLLGISGAVELGEGGTGAKTGPKALMNLGAAPAEHTHSAATPLTDGFLSTADKSKLDALPNAAPGAPGGVATLNESGKLQQMPCASDIPGISVRHSTYFGNLGSADLFTFEFIAKLHAFRHPGGMWEVNLGGKVTQNDSTGEDFGYGLNQAMIKSAVGIPQSAMYLGSLGIAFLPDDTFSGRLEEYAFEFQTRFTNDGPLRPARYYLKPGTSERIIGAWGSNTAIAKVGAHYRGTLWYQE